MKNKYISNLVLITGIILFISGFVAIFTAKNTLVGVSCITALLLFSAISINIKTTQATILIASSFFLVGLTVFLPFLNLFFALLLNFILIIIILLLTSSYFPAKSYIAVLMCYVFTSGEPVAVPDIPLRVSSLVVTGILVSAVYYIKHRNNGETTTIRQYLSSLTPASEQVIYAIKMAVGLSIGLLCIHIFQVQKGIWITITIMSLTQIDSEVLMTRAKHRLLGTLIGSIVFVFLFEYLLPSELHIFVTLALSYAYTFMKDYFYQLILITISALGSASALFSTNVSIPLRISYLLIGTAIAFAVHFLPRLLPKKAEE